MNEREAREAARLRETAYAALKRGAMKTAREAIEALMPFDREEALGMLTSLGIETNDAETAEKALKELETLAPEKPYTRYLSARVAYMKGARASLIGPLESLLADKNVSAEIRERVCNLLGRSCRQLGEAEKAAKYDLEASRIAPELGADEYGNYLYDLHYLPGISPEEQREAAARYDDFFRGVQPFRHRRRHGKRPLRVGYISADFRYHVVLRFVAAMLWGHGKMPFMVCAYMTGPEDAYSEALAGRVDVWRNLRGLSPEAAARRIYEDEIDILVELGGHTVGNSLPVLAYKPAPVQISGIGYWASTGLSAIDYFLGDAFLDDEETQKAFTEKLLVLPRTHFCYTEVGDIPLPAEEPPCFRSEGGAVTFGSFNDFGKMSDGVLRLWAEILAKVSGSRLLLKGKIFDAPDNRAYALARLERMGIPRDRVEARAFSLDYLGEYADMDIALDTFPYPGGGTTCDALFMGVPVVTMAGADHGGRFGKSLLMNLGLGELVADTPEAYVEKAAGLAGDKELLLAFRKNLRDMMRRSPLMDSGQYRNDLAAAYAAVWERFVREQPMPGPSGLSESEDNRERGAIRMRISACYIVKNEAAKLSRSLASVKGEVDEIIVVDTGSTDGTVQVAEAHGARVFHFPWRDDFAAARNVSLSKATGDWILVVDADEYFSGEMAGHIRPAVERYGKDADLLIFLRRELDEDNGKVLLDTYVSRLLRRVEGLAYEGAIHEEPRHGGKTITRIVTLPEDALMMMHTGYSATLLRAKAERNLALLRREMESGHPRDSIYMYMSETLDGMQDEEQALKYAWMDVRMGRKPFVFASRTYCILIRILAKHPERYRERRRATALAVRDFPEVPEFHAEYAECLGYGLDYQGAIRECRTAMEVFASGAGCGLEPSMFTQETADFVKKRMEMWKELDKSEKEEEPLRALARQGSWRELSREAERAAWKCGVRLLTLLLLMEDVSEEESAALAGKMLPPDLALLWAAYRGGEAADERLEAIYGRVLADVVPLLGKANAARFAAFAGGFSMQGRTEAARVLMQAEAWALALPLLENLEAQAESLGDAYRMKGICLYHLGRRDEAKQALRKAQEIEPTAEADSYLRWLGEATGNA